MADYPTGRVQASYTTQDGVKVWIILWGANGAALPAHQVSDRHFKEGQRVLFVDGVIVPAINGSHT